MSLAYCSFTIFLKVFLFYSKVEEQENQSSAVLVHSLNV